MVISAPSPVFESERNFPSDALRVVYRYNENVLRFRPSSRDAGCFVVRCETLPQARQIGGQSLFAL